MSIALMKALRQEDPVLAPLPGHRAPVPTPSVERFEARAEAGTRLEPEPVLLRASGD